MICIKIARLAWLQAVSPPCATPRQVRASAIIAAGLAVAMPAAAAVPKGAVDYPMDAIAWTAEPADLLIGSEGAMGDEAATAKFSRHEGMPNGTLTLSDGVASSKVAQFSTGTIDFDMQPLGYNDAGLIFHRRGATDGEFVYLRADPECPASNDCIQYAPITHAMMGWNIYSNYQGPAPISTTGWNHVRVEVIGTGMRVYINHAAEPSLVVPRLWGLTDRGGIGFKGPAIYANLVIDPHRPPGASAVPAEPVDPNMVSAWLSTAPTIYHRGAVVTADSAPPAVSWHPIAAEPSGLVDLGRAFGLARAPSPSLGWLKTEFTAAAPVSRTVQIGFAEEVWVFLNGRLIYSGQNQYHPPENRLAPDGRLEPDNATVKLTLRKGKNELMLAVGNDWRSSRGPFEPTPFGWAAEARFDSLEKLSLSAHD